MGVFYEACPSYFSILKYEQATRFSPMVMGELCFEGSRITTCGTLEGVPHAYYCNVHSSLPYHTQKHLRFLLIAPRRIINRGDREMR